MPIFVHGVSVVAHADVGSNGIPALVLTTSIIHRTLVDVREEDGRKTRPLDGLVRVELQSQGIAL